MAGRMQGAQIWRRILAAPAWHARLRATPSFWAAKKMGEKSRQEVFLPDCPAARHIGTACQAVRALGGCGLTRQGDMNFRNIAAKRWTETEPYPRRRACRAAFFRCHGQETSHNNVGQRMKPTHNGAACRVVPAVSNGAVRSRRHWLPGHRAVNSKCGPSCRSCRRWRRRNW